MGVCYTKYQIKKIEKESLNYKYEETIQFIPPLNKKYVYVCKIYDGDTFTIATKLPWEKSKLYRFSVRVKGIDCPELRTKNENEKYVALKAKEYLTRMLRSSNNIVKLDNIIYDKYGRLCSDVYINEINYKERIIEQRLAVSYDGGCKVSPLNWRNYYENKDTKI